MKSSFVGREREVNRGARALRSSRVLAIRGAAGVGKSRLMAELIERHQAQGHPVYAVTASEATRRVPLSPLIGLVDSDLPPDISLLTAAIVQAVRASTPVGRSHLIAIDDAHHLDDGSVAAIAALLAGTSTTIVVTVRDEAESPAAVMGMLRQDHATRLDLLPLSAEETRELVESTVGPTTDEVQDRLWELTQGNPLMVRELLARLGDESTVADPLSAATLTDLVRERLRALGPEVADAMRLVAVGAPLPLSIVADAVDSSVADELVQRGLVDVAGSGVLALVRPAHPLDGEVLRAALTPTYFARLCDQLVRSAIKTGAKLDPLRLATWQRDAGEPREIGLAVAGVQAALGRHDGALALLLLDHIAGSLPTATETLMRATALIQLQQCDEAEACLSAFSSDPGIDPETAVGLVTARAFNLAFGLGSPQRADAVLAAAAADQADSAVRFRLAAERGVIAGIAGDFETAAAAARGVLDETDPPAPTVTSASVTMTLATAMRGEVDQLQRWVEPGRAAARATAHELPMALDQIELMAATGCLIAGDLPGFDTLASAALSDPHRHLVHWLWRMFRAARSCVDGRLDAGYSDARSAEAQSALARTFDLEPAIAGVAGMVRGHVGDPTGLDALDTARATRVDPRNSIWMDRGRVWLRAAAGEIDAARRIAIDHGQEAVGQNHRSYGIPLLHDAVRLGAGEGLESAVTVLSVEVARMSGAHLAEVMSRHGAALVDADPDALLVVASSFGQLGARLLAAESAAQAATTARRLGQTTSSARAHALARAWQQTCPEARTPALIHLPPPPITDRVLEVALAAARGATSLAISERLHLSVRTVDNHLGTAYRELDLGGRDDLAATLAPFIQSRA